MHGTHRGGFRGIAFTGIGILRFSEGKVFESWDSFD